MGHRALSYLNEHREDRFLQREAKILWSVLTGADQRRSLILDEGQQSGERDVHAFHDVRQLQETLATLGHLLDVVAGTGVVGEGENARKAIRKARRRVDALYADEEDITEHFAESAKALHWANFWIDAVLKQAKRLPEPRSRRLAEAPPEVKP